MNEYEIQNLDTAAELYNNLVRFGEVLDGEMPLVPSNAELIVYMLSTPAYARMVEARFEQMFDSKKEVFQVVDFKGGIFYPFDGTELECRAWMLRNQEALPNGKSRYGVQYRPN